jgi:hypothetical protein
MKVKYTDRNGAFSVELEGDTQKDIFSQLAKFQEVFGESSCGKCGSTNLKFVVRAIDDNEYFEIRCMDCGAKLAFGVHKKGGGLFPKKKDEQGNWLPNKGWTTYNKATGKNE